MQHALEFGAGDDVTGARLAGVAVGGDHDGDRGAAGPLQRGVLGELAGGGGVHEPGDRGAQQRQHDLRFGVAEAAVELDDRGAVGGQREPGVEQAGEGGAAVHQLVGDRLDDPFDELVYQVLGRPRQRRVRTHATGVGAMVTVVAALVIL